MNAVEQAIRSALVSAKANTSLTIDELLNIVMTAIATEREACAKIADEKATICANSSMSSTSSANGVRWEAREYEAKRIAAAIRARTP